jgi:hypothetical protein
MTVARGALLLGIIRATKLEAAPGPTKPSNQEVFQSGK